MAPGDAQVTRIHRWEVGYDAMSGPTQTEPRPPTPNTGTRRLAKGPLLHARCCAQRRAGEEERSIILVLLLKVEGERPRRARARERASVSSRRTCAAGPHSSKCVIRRERCTVHRTVLYRTVPYRTVPYCTVLYCTVALYCSVRYMCCTATVMYRTVPYRTVPYRTVL